MRRILLASALTTAAISNTINSIEFNGLHHLSSEHALKASGLKIGSNYDEDLINTSLKNLYSFGFFEQISVDDTNGNLRFDVLENSFISKVKISGITSSDRKQIESFINIKKGEALKDNKIANAKEKIALYYQAKGYYDTVIETSTTELGNNSVMLEFIINRGKQVIIDEVKLNGAKALKYSDFESHIANKEKEFLGWFWGFNDGKLRTLELMNDPGKIKNVYLNKGYLDANVSQGILQANMQNYTAKLSYYIDEGKRYKIAEINIENPLKERVKIKKSKLKSKQNRYVNYEKIQKDIAYIQEQFANEGYALAKVVPDIKKVDEARITIDFRINLGEIYTIDKVSISGNDKSLDRIIRRELYLSEGMKFSKIDLDDSVIALKKTGYFEDVKIIPVPKANNKMDLLVEVSERPTGSITGGIGYSSEDGFLINASIKDRNLLGSGLSAGFDVKRSEKDLTGKLFLKNPRLFDTKYFGSISVYSYKRDWDDYEEYNKGFDLGIGREFWRYFGAGSVYNYEKSDLRKATNKMLASGEKLGKSDKSAITPYIYFDNTDDYYLPRKGIYARAAYTYVGFSGSQDYRKASFDFKSYYGLKEDFDIDVIFRYRLSANKIYKYSKTPLNSRLYLGGLGSVRGFEADSITPKGVGAFAGMAYEYDKGGALSLNSSAELNFPVIDKLQLRASIFYDFGMIGIRSFDEIKRQSYGISLDWNTPMGPLNFVFAWPVKKYDGDKTSRFEFSMGSQF